MKVKRSTAGPSLFDGASTKMLEEDMEEALKRCLESTARVIHKPVYIPIEAGTFEVAFGFLKEVPVPLGEEEVVVVPKVVKKPWRRELLVEQPVDVPVPQLQEELLVTPVLMPMERLVQRPVQKIVEVPVPQVVEEEVPVPCVVDQEDVEFQVVEQIVPVHRPQIVEKVVEVPKAGAVYSYDCRRSPHVFTIQKPSKSLLKAIG